jgi:hypothetical protein
MTRCRGTAVGWSEGSDPAPKVAMTGSKTRSSSLDRNQGSDISRQVVGVGERQGTVETEISVHTIALAAFGTCQVAAALHRGLSGQYRKHFLGPTECCYPSNMHTVPDHCKARSLATPSSVTPADASRKRLIIRKLTSLPYYIILTVTSATISKAGVGTPDAVPTRLNVPCSLASLKTMRCA